jgi:hypothetical protein
MFVGWIDPYRSNSRKQQEQQPDHSFIHSFQLFTHPMAGRVCIPRQMSSPDGLNVSSNTFETWVNVESRCMLLYFPAPTPQRKDNC